MTIDLEGESGAKLDLADSQLYMCNESNDSDEEAEANNVLNELNDLILNMKQKDDLDGFEVTSDVEMGSINDEREDYNAPDLYMPRT